MHLLLPSQSVQGVLLPDGQRLSYKLNAFTVFVIVYGSAIAVSFGSDTLDLSWIYQNFLPLLTASIIFSTVLAIYVYLASFEKGRQSSSKLLAASGTSGVAIYDFWMGRELNPRIAGIDIKEFCELYPGMIGWALLNLAMAYKQYKQLGYVTNSMLLVNIFELWYIADGLYNEKSILTTMDITTDGFGFMLSFGDLTWVPFVFSTQARYLADYQQDLSPLVLASIIGVQLLGYFIFRGANGQKDTFRRDPKHPSVAHLQTLPTKRGTKLIISGWWVMARHINYLGDWIMGLAWCLPCGLQGLKAIIPYFYCIYFATLLIHRERRDEHACRHKYGADWDKYCALVRWRIIPYIY
eukprot:jgi/Chrzof1/14619/Cz09g09210.t1